ncbi:MAG: 4-(cytidine 5'-diphospho)-2-C-methyl-D-erythritol kinase [Candidatus Gastranaerophilaceae bacterium]
MEIKVKCPAKINLTLEILNKRSDGFHDIQSVMQTIDLFDILTITAEKSNKFEIKLSGTSDEIPYDESNLVYKAIELFMSKFPRPGEEEYSELGKGRNASNYSISIQIEKNIPVAAGLAGGSTDAAGTLWGLNKLFDNIFSDKELHELCAKLGSDLNFCLEGGCRLATGRGEILEKLPFQEFRLSLVKPKSLGISAKEAYTKFSLIENKPNFNMTKKLVKALKSNNDIEDFLHNDLEFAVINDYKELQEIKMEYPEAIMSGSGSTFFAINVDFKDFRDEFWIKNGLKSIPYGVCEK